MVTYAFLFGNGSLLRFLVLEIFDVIEKLFLLLLCHVFHKLLFPLLIFLLDFHLLFIELLLIMLSILFHSNHERFSFFSFGLVLFFDEFLLNPFFIIFFLVNLFLYLSFLVQFLLICDLEFFFVLINPINPLFVVNLLGQLSVQTVLWVKRLAKRNVYSGV